ncbi:uncharacterized [Tachysurus ichikawai]
MVSIISDLDPLKSWNVLRHPTFLYFRQRALSCHCAGDPGFSLTRYVPQSSCSFRPGGTFNVTQLHLGSCLGIDVVLQQHRAEDALRKRGSALAIQMFCSQ